jgi:hypothetical protein
MAAVSTMITIELPPHGVGAVRDDDIPTYTAARVLSATWPANTRPPEIPHTRALVEVQRRLGGLAPRALLGGEFVASDGAETSLEVAISAFSVFDTINQPSCPSQLWKRPFNVGLPKEFGAAVLAGVRTTMSRLPAGVLRIDRAGYDLVNSSEPVFEMAAGLLTATIAAIVYGLNIEFEAKSVISH